jgi:hypothetical protein
MVAIMNQNPRNRSIPSRQFGEVRPPSDSSPYPDPIPSGYDPMGDIYLRGRAARNLAGGNIRWWVIISSWLLFGTLTSLLLLVAIAGESPHILFAFGIILIVYGIPLLRGTLVKLKRR